MPNLKLPRDPRQCDLRRCHGDPKREGGDITPAREKNRFLPRVAVLLADERRQSGLDAGTLGSLRERAGPLHCPRIHHPGRGGTAPDRRDPFGPRQFSDFSRHYVSLPFNPPHLPSSGTSPFPRIEYHERWEAALRSSDPATRLKVVRPAAEVAEAHGLSAIKRA
ncbi:hypothetical protein HPB47_027404 [Ixodes persulcatus]|uniref:Uncharacterized protein n=1 Tax=Ixodes persulcatus TaxID=34615 RepID=A0AC60PWL1_IXOPE|nr:hypothetical protein HPB47_027404 [Ixodes persulcatus]